MPTLNSLLHRRQTVSGANEPSSQRNNNRSRSQSRSRAMLNRANNVLTRHRGGSTSRTRTVSTGYSSSQTDSSHIGYPLIEELRRHTLEPAQEPPGYVSRTASSLTVTRLPIYSRRGFSDTSEPSQQDIDWSKKIYKCLKTRFKFNKHDALREMLYTIDRVMTKEEWDSVFNNGFAFSDDLYSKTIKFSAAARKALTSEHTYMLSKKDPCSENVWLASGEIQPDTPSYSPLFTPPSHAVNKDAERFILDLFKERAGTLKSRESAILSVIAEVRHRLTAEDYVKLLSADLNDKATLAQILSGCIFFKTVLEDADLNGEEPFEFNELDTELTSSDALAEIIDELNSEEASDNETESLWLNSSRSRALSDVTGTTPTFSENVPTVHMTYTTDQSYDDNVAPGTAI